MNEVVQLVTTWEIGCCVVKASWRDERSGESHPCVVSRLPHPGEVLHCLQMLEAEHSTGAEIFIGVDFLVDVIEELFNQNLVLMSEDLEDHGGLCGVRNGVMVNTGGDGVQVQNEGVGIYTHPHD